MPYTQIDASYIGKGSVFAGPYDGSGPLRDLGNISELVFNVTDEEKTLKDYTSAGGGNANSIRRVDKVEVQLKLHDFSAENLALLLRGATGAVTAGAVVDESHANVKQGGLVRTAAPIDLAQSVTVKVGATTHTVNTDYLLTPGGVVIVDGGAILDNDTVLVSYTRDAASTVQTLLTSAPELKLHLVGLNEAQSGRPVLIDIHRARLGAPNNIGFLGDDFGELQVTGEVLSDSAIAGGGLSKFFVVTQVS